VRNVEPTGERAEGFETAQICLDRILKTRRSRSVGLPFVGRDETEKRKTLTTDAHTPQTHKLVRRVLGSLKLSCATGRLEASESEC
jgi:hypothetical protein